MINSLIVTLTNDDTSKLLYELGKIKKYLDEENVIKTEYCIKKEVLDLKFGDAPLYVTVNPTVNSASDDVFFRAHVESAIVNLDETLTFISFSACTLNVDKETFKIIKELLEV